MSSGGFSSDDLLRQAHESLRSETTDRGSAPHPAAPAVSAPGSLDAPRRSLPSEQASVPEHTVRPAAARPKRNWSLGRLLRIGGLGIVGVVFLTNFFDDTTAVQDLEAGICFNDQAESVVYEIDPIDCAEPHHYEVIGNVTLAGDSYPGDDAAWEAAMRTCIGLFEGYVGTTYEESTWWVDAFTPTADAWDQGDRGANCVVFQPLGERELRSLTGTARHSGI